MIQHLFDLTEPEIIMEIMSGAPTEWSLYIDTARIGTTTELQDLICYYEDPLSKDAQHDQCDLERRIRALESRKFQHPTQTHIADTNFTKIGKGFKKPFRNKSVPFKKYPFPKNDNIVTKDGKTPGQRGCKPC
jgi:hypothetical protein